MAALVSVYLDKRVSKTEDIYPLKIRVTFNRERRYYGLEAKKINELLRANQGEEYLFKGAGNYSISEAVFNKTKEENIRGIYRKLRDIFNKIQVEYQAKADKIKPFSFEAFAYEFDRTRPENDVFIMMERRIQQLEDLNRIGTASSYRCSLNSLKDFAGKKSVPFEFFTENSLLRYEHWMKTGDKKKTTTTIGIYLRSLRAVFNEAIKAGITEHYPFGKGGFSIQNGKGRKIAMETDEIKSIFDYEIKDDDAAAFYLDIWKVTYLLNGINIKDLVLLKKENISGDFICFVREKTKNTAKEKAEIKIFFSDEARQILVKWGKIEDRTYLVPLLNGNETEKEIKQKVNNLVRAINNALENVAKLLEINKNITCYTARHSWATQMMRHGAPVAFIGKQLGHMNSSSTDNYLNSFEDETIKQWQKKLTEFNK